MQKNLLTLTICLMAACEKSNPEAATPLSGNVDRVCTSCNVLGGGTAYIIYYQKSTGVQDSLLVPGIKAGVSVGNDVLFNFREPKEGDVAMVCQSSPQLPPRGIVTSMKKK